jgi:hypothetical protein
MSENTKACLKGALNAGISGIAAAQVQRWLA